MTAAGTLRVGIDLCATDDVARAVDSFGDRYLRRVFTPAEVAYCTAGGVEANRRLAARFAAKEATAKVLRAGELGLDLKTIEIERQPGGWCELRLSGTAAALAAQQGLENFAVSLTHEHGMATAVVVAQGHPASTQVQEATDDH